jgi:cysteine desulfuration protein SufE
VLFDDLIAEFDGLDDREKLELLVEFADELAPLSASRSHEDRPEACRVLECQTPVHVWIDVLNDRVRFEADVPVSAPTVRGIIALVQQGIQDRSVSEVLAVPEDILPALGLSTALGMQRREGMRGVMRRIQQDVRMAASP